MKVGDIVKVDVGYANGGYKAKIVWLGKRYTARIKYKDKEWSILQSRLTPLKKDSV